MRCTAEMPIKHEAKPSVLMASRHAYWHQGMFIGIKAYFIGIKACCLASRWCAKCFIWCIARARPCFNCFKEFTHEHLVKTYPFQSISCPSTSSSQVRQCWTVSSANTSVRSFNLAILTYFGYIVMLF